MTMAWVAVGVGVLGAGASIAGANKQAKASEKAGQLNMDMFNTLNRQQQPFIQSGYGAMGRLNTLLGLNPNPNYRSSAPSPMPANPGYMPTPGGGVQPIMQMGYQPGAQPSGNPAMGTSRLAQLLALRAAHGDQSAAQLLKQGMG